MKLNKIFSNTEYTTKEVLAYLIVANNEIDKLEEKSLFNCIQIILKTVEDIDKKEILTKIDTSLIANFPFYHKMNNEEFISYSIVTFKNLINSNREITNENIVSEFECVMKLNSSRNILEIAEHILNEIKKKSNM